MDSNRIREIIIELLQDSYKENVSPQNITDAIITKINFEKPYSEVLISRLIQSLTDDIENYRRDMKRELSKLEHSDKLLGNFIRGKITAYCEILKIINEL